MAQHKQNIEKTLQSAWAHKQAGSKVAIATLAIESLVQSGIETSAMVENTDAKEVGRLIAAASHKKIGRRLADAIATMEQIIADESLSTETSPEVPAEAAQFIGQVDGMTTDITLDADTAGEDGNDIILIGDGVKDIDELVSDWNTANPGNTVTVADGDGTQVPNDQEEIQLAGGSDLIPAVIEPLEAEDVMIDGQHKQNLRKVLESATALKATGVRLSDMVSLADKAVDALIALYEDDGDKEDSQVEANLLLVRAALDSVK